MIKWTGEVSNTLIQVWCLKILHYIFHIFHFSEKVSWAWQVHILRWMVCPVKKTVWHIKYFVYLILFVLLDFYISLFSWLLSATSVLPTVQFSLNILPLMFPERMCGEWIWQIWTNPSMSSLQLYYFPEMNCSKNASYDLYPPPLKYIHPFLITPEKSLLESFKTLTYCRKMWHTEWDLE